MARFYEALDWLDAHACVLKRATLHSSKTALHYVGSATPTSATFFFTPVVKQQHLLLVTRPALVVDDRCCFGCCCRVCVTSYVGSRESPRNSRSRAIVWREPTWPKGKHGKLILLLVSWRHYFFSQVSISITVVVIVADDDGGTCVFFPMFFFLFCCAIQSKLMSTSRVINSFIRCNIGERRARYSYVYKACEGGYEMDSWDYGPPMYSGDSRLWRVRSGMMGNRKNLVYSTRITIKNSVLLLHHHRSGVLILYQMYQVVCSSTCVHDPVVHTT